LLTLPLIAAGEGSLEWTYVAASAGEWLLLSALVELLLGLLQPQGAQPGRRDGVPQTVSRRRFLAWAGSAAGAVSLGYLGQQLLAAAAPPLPKLHLGRLLDGPQGAAANGLTATRDFYVVSKDLFGPPSVDSASWRLTVEGLKPYSIGYSELRQLLHVRRIQTLECISNPVGGTLISTGIWRGVRLSSLLRRAGVPAGTAQVQFDCADGYTESLPLAQALAPTTLVADELNGTPLTAPHGFPARVLAVDHYGMKNPKWLLAIRPTAHSYLGYWEQQGWEAGAYPKIVSRFDFPSGNSSLGAHRGYLLSGIAFAGTRGISKVELSVDGSRKWLRAELRPVLSPYSWTIWTYPWRPTPGYYTLSVRAVDGLGNVQQPGAGQTYPSGANGYQALTIVVR
ncbi:MAG: molybdopterin-dependent oxidoreductase, partial [Candidatus Dormibacteria bacterium]